MKGPTTVLAVLLSFAIQFTADAEYVIKFSHTAGPATAKGRAAEFFAEEVNKRLAGKLRVEVFPDGTLYDDAAVLDAVRQATGDTGVMAAPNIVSLVHLSAGLGIFELPFLFDRVADVHRVVDSSLRAKLLQPLEDEGIKGLAIWDLGMKVFSVRGMRPLRKPPEDFQDKKIGTSAGDVDKAVIEALGGVPRELPESRRFGALSNGELDGQESDWFETYDAKLYQVQDWISVSDHLYRGFLVIVGAEFWNGLPARVREELTTILAESTTKNRELAAEAAAEDRRRVEESGAAIVLGLTSEERETWRNATAVVEKQFAARIGEDLIAEVRELLRQPVLDPAEFADTPDQPEEAAAARAPVQPDTAALKEPSGSEAALESPPPSPRQ